MIRRCPSGRLAYRTDRESDDVEPDLAPAVWVIDDCQYVLTGGVQVVRADGTAEEVRNRVSLCRCGSSGNKPYCDGTHFDVRFTDAGRRPSRPFGD